MSLISGKKGKWIAFAALLMILCMGVSVFAAGKNGLVKEVKKDDLTGDKKINYYYYKSGKKVKNTWKTVKKKRYYFGKNGAAYKAKEDSRYRSNLKVVKIKGKRYAFDAKARLLTYKQQSGQPDYQLYVDNEKLRLWAVKPSGEIDEQQTQTVRSEVPSAAGTQVKDQVIKLFGSPLKQKVDTYCFGTPWDDTFSEEESGLNRPIETVILVYPMFEISLVHNKKNNEYVVDDFSPLQK